MHAMSGFSVSDETADDRRRQGDDNVAVGDTWQSENMYDVGVNSHIDIYMHDAERACCARHQFTMALRQTKALS